MSLEKDIMSAMKEAMKAKDQTALAALRAVKSEILLAKTSGGDEGLSEDEEIKIVRFTHPNMNTQTNTVGKNNRIKR